MSEMLRNELTVDKFFSNVGKCILISIRLQRLELILLRAKMLLFTSSTDLVLKDGLLLTMDEESWF